MAVFYGRRNPFHVSVVAFMVVVMVVAKESEGRSMDQNLEYTATSCRNHTVSVVQFGAVGDGVTLNTKAFIAAVDHLRQFESDGGGLLYVPAGRWVTGCFNLTSHFTLYLHRDAVLLGSQDFRTIDTVEFIGGIKTINEFLEDMNEWPLIEPLPSYGRGRDAPGRRYSSLIFGYNLTDVIITGDNGTIDGQGEMWWKLFRNEKLDYTRGYLIEIQNTDQILISNVTLVNSPSWSIHPVYSRNVVVSGVTILAPVDSPNTDGINPDSCSQVLIQDSYVVSGDDCIALKSGWDEYGIAVGIPTKHVSIKRFTCISPTSAVIAVGSEMSGGIKDVRAENITAVNSESGVRIKTAIGRGNYVKDIFVRNMVLKTMKYAFWMTGTYGSHPDNKYDPKAIPVVANISYGNVIAENVTIAGKLEGIEGAPFTGICIYNTTIDVIPSKKMVWNCTDVSGVTSGVSPPACSALPENTGGGGQGQCSFPEERLPIEGVQFKQCYLNL